ncbi:MAG: hypothetical protein COA42_20875 [Alteromonadaceae bacterium]|nr:MAG: hypothetical protein COA42_20875 [Alteromonadaceae bacterium]
MYFFKQHLRWILAGWIAFVFVQSLFFKFTNSLETQHIFGVLGEWSGLVWFGEYGGYIVGGVELIAAGILFTRFWAWGAFVAFEVMSGAIIFHLFTPLGIVMPKFDDMGNLAGNDSGALFVMACLTLLSAGALVIKDWTSEQSQIRSVLPINKA